MTRSNDSFAGFRQHGVRLGPAGPNGWAISRCPFCGKTGKFRASATEANWMCMVCDRKGDFKGFMGQIMDVHRRTAKRPGIMNALAVARGLRVETLHRWGVGYESTSECYMIPLTDSEGRVCNVHRYALASKRILSTTGGRSGAGIAVPVGGPGDDPAAWVCEGEWDAMALDEAVRLSGRKDAVLGLAGAMVLPPFLPQALAGRDVRVAMDHDDAGAKGDARARFALGSSVRKIRSVHWPREFTQGFDVRDLWLRYSGKPNTFFQRLEGFLRDEPRPAPGPMKEAAKPAGNQPTGVGLPRDEVIERYRKWLHIPNTAVIDIVFGTMLANRLDGSPLWVFLVAPPGGLKTEMIMSLYDAPMIASGDSMTPASLISGQQGLGGVDPSALTKWKDKVVLIKDFTTILTMNPKARDEIMGILRSAYDGRVEKYFGGSSIQHRVCISKFGILAGVTPRIDAFGTENSVVGERFIKYRIPSDGRIEVASAAIDCVIDRVDKQQSTEMRDDLRAVGRETLDRAVGPEDAPRIGAEVKDRFRGLAQWAAAMRGGVSRNDYTRQLVTRPVAEIGTRIAGQLCKLAQGIALFRDRDRVGPDEYEIAAQVARDCAPDLVEDIVRALYTRRRNAWTSVEELCEITRYQHETVQGLLDRMSLLWIIVRRRRKGFSSVVWRLSSTVTRLMQPLGLYSREMKWLK